MPKPYDLLDEILSDAEKEYIQQFYMNEPMRESVKKVLLACVYYNGVLQKNQQPNPLVNFALGLVSNKIELKLSNEEIGEKLSTQWEAIQLIEMALSNMAKFKPIERERSEENQAR